MPSVYLLSIGINTYQSQDINKLNGCVNDVKKLKKCLVHLGMVKRAHCLMLQDQQASRQGIIKAFRQHFGQIKDGDIALLHFSGHGTRQRVPLALSDAGHEVQYGKMEATCCYDSNCGNTYSIADKEWRWLISELQSQKPNSLFVGIFDCCHSGSMTRDEGTLIRNTLEAKDARPLHTLLEGQYQQMLDQGKALNLPSINYLSLAACAHDEGAYEDAQGGYLTNALIQCLQNNPSIPTYADLHYSCRHTLVRRSKNRQHPYLDYWGTANPYQLFLEDSISLDSNMPRLYRGVEEWQVPRGAIHGIPLLGEQKNTLAIYEEGQSTPMGWAKIKAVHLEKTIIDPQWISTPPTNNATLSIALFAPAIGLQLDGDDTSNSFVQVLQQKGIAHSQASNFHLQTEASYALQLRPHSIQLYHLSNTTRKLLIGLQGESPLALDWLLQQIHWISKWEILQQIRTPPHSTLSADKINFFFHAEIDAPISRSENPAALHQNITIPYPAHKIAIPYHLSIQHSSAQPLYCFLIHLDRKYGIQQKHEDYGKAIYRNISEELYNSQAQTPPGGLGIREAEVKTSTDTFILIASTSELSYPQYFRQQGFGNDFGKILVAEELQQGKEDISDSQDSRPQQNWVVKRIQVHLERL